MILVKANRDSEAGVLPSKELVAAMGKFNDEMMKAGVLLAGDGLHPKDEAMAWASRAPFGDGEEIEIFPPEILPPADAAREQAWREEQQRKSAKG
jgi:hypothetical protein